MNRYENVEICIVTKKKKCSVKIPAVNIRMVFEMTTYDTGVSLINEL